MNLSPLYQPVPPWLLLHVVSGEDRDWIPSFQLKAEGSCPVIRTLRGKKMKSLQGLMDEFGAALQFFEDFGENWHALKDCLRYLDEWLPGDAYILVVTKPHQLLIDGTPDDLNWFMQTILEVGEWWRTPITDNGRFNRRPVPFHVVLRCEPRETEEVRKRFGELQAL